jgi:hypothetical protein
MAVTSIPSELGRVCGVVIRARTLSRGVYDIVIGERGVVLVPLGGPSVPRGAAVLFGGFQGGALGHRRGAASDDLRRTKYLALMADELARHYFTNTTIRPADLEKGHVWSHKGSGKLRLELTDGTSWTFRWEKRANPDVDAAKLCNKALGKKLEVRG